MKINDGTGKGYEAQVDETNRLHVESIQIPEQIEAALEGKSFQVGSGPINLTTDTTSGILYLRNNEEKDLLLTGINITSTKQTGSTDGVFTAILYTSPTGLSAGTNPTALNNNFGSSRVLDADITAGQEGATVTNGVPSGSFYIEEGVFFHTEISWILPKGATVAIGITPGSGNTDMTITITLETHISRT